MSESVNISNSILIDIMNHPAMGAAMQEIARVSFVAGWLMGKNLTMEDVAECRRAEAAFDFFQHKLWEQEHEN